MFIGDAQARILDALSGMDIDCIDDAKTIRPEGLLLSFEGMNNSGFNPEEFMFGLYISKKILNKKTQSIYAEIDSICEKILEYSVLLEDEDAIKVRSVTPVSFDNGILEYRIGITVK